MTSQRGFAHAFLIVGLVVALMGALGFVFWQNFIYREPIVNNETTSSTNNSAKPAGGYKGAYTTGGNFQIKVPNGWGAGAAPFDDYKGSYVVVLAGPNQLDSLRYDAAKEPDIKNLAGLGWDGLTEHFYVISQEDYNRDLSKYSSEDFKLDGGIVGKKYTLITKKNDQGEFYQFSEDADSYSQYLYEFKKDDVVVRAYLNLYSNSTFDINLAERVIKSIKFE